MKDVLDRLVHKIHMATIDPLPSENIYLEEIFDPAIYAEILARIPCDEVYQYIEHPDAILPNGKVTRKLLTLTDDSIQLIKTEDQLFWQQMQEILTSTKLQFALMQKFKVRIQERFGDNWPDMVIVPIFYRDFPGYKIGIHPDAPSKLATMQFYFPRDESQIHLGTSFHQKVNNQFQLLKTNPFKPNSAYAFVRTDTSWHSVKQLAVYESQRDSLALTIYQKGHEFKQSKTY